MPLNKAEKYAVRFLKLLDGWTLKANVAGSVRRRCDTVGDVEIVCVPQPLKDLSQLFIAGYKGMVVNGPRLKRFKYPDLNLQIELYITTEIDFGRIFAIRTGSSAYSHGKLAITWNRLGWCGSKDGLRRKAECIHKGSTWIIKPEFEKDPTKPPPFYEEEDFFKFLGLDWEDPRKRDWKSKEQKLNYS